MIHSPSNTGTSVSIEPASITTTSFLIKHTTNNHLIPKLITEYIIKLHKCKVTTSDDIYRSARNTITTKIHRYA